MFYNQLAAHTAIKYVGQMRDLKTGFTKTGYQSYPLPL